MTKFRKEIINNIDVWFVVNPLIWHDRNRAKVIPTDKFICFFNFEEPNEMIYGEMIKEDNGIPRQFGNEKEALEYGRKYLVERFKLK